MAKRKNTFLTITVSLFLPLFSIGKVNILDCGEKIKFEKHTIKLGQKTLEVEVAQTPNQIRRGLMCRKKLKTGMLFIFKKPEELSFWMKNTFIPLSIAFFDRGRKILNIEKMKPMKSVMEIPQVSYRSKGLALYALEVPQGWFKKNKITPGAKFIFLDSL